MLELKDGRPDRIPYINIADTNVWIVYLMPFPAEDRGNYELVDRIQQECIAKRIFGMGWEIPFVPYGTGMTDELADRYIEEYEKIRGSKTSMAAVKGYNKVARGDYVIMRLKNGHYYVGRVSSDGAYYLYKPEDAFAYFSWGCSVEDWVEYENDADLPSEIVGRFSQRLHSTIQRIAAYRQRLLVISMYESRQPESKRRFRIPKLHIGIHNFVRSLNYMELEDLVALYISRKHREEGYMLLPSSCKVSQQNYEFMFVANGRKPITCQVKNQYDGNGKNLIDRYVEERVYEKIYVYIGSWSVADIERLRDDYRKHPHICLIDHQELFDVLRESEVFQNDFYHFTDRAIRPENLPLEGYQKVDSIHSEKEYTLTDDFACFIAKDGFFYSAEFGAFILAWHVLYTDLDKESRLISQIVNEVNDRLDDNAVGERKKAQMNKEYEIVPLPKEEWKGTPILMVVESEEYYDVQLEKQTDGYTVSLRQKKAEQPIRHTPEEYDFPDSLYQDHWEKAQAWGIVEMTCGRKNILACIETCPEEWSNRLMVTELWVHEKLRRRGIGHRLMAIAKQQAKEEKRRALILETQSYNVGAIAFYLQEGFELIGFDSCCYANNDIERREVRLDLGIIFEGFPAEKRALG